MREAFLVDCVDCAAGRGEKWSHLHWYHVLVLYLLYLLYFMIYLYKYYIVSRIDQLRTLVWQFEG